MPVGVYLFPIHKKDEMDEMADMQIKKKCMKIKWNFCWCVTFLELDYDIRNNATNIKLKWYDIM